MLKQFTEKNLRRPLRGFAPAFYILHSAFCIPCVVALGGLRPYFYFLLSAFCFS